MEDNLFTGWGSYHFDCADGLSCPVREQEKQQF